MARDEALSGRVAKGDEPARREMPWRRVVFDVMRALVPLPVVLVCDAWLLRAAYALGSAILPPVVVAFAVLSYAGFLALVFGLTYAAIPLLLMRRPAPMPAGRQP